MSEDAKRDAPLSPLQIDAMGEEAYAWLVFESRWTALWKYIDMAISGYARPVRMSDGTIDYSRIIYGDA